MTETEIIERLMYKAEQVRKAQVYYFKNRDNVNKKISIAKEIDLDNYLKELRKKGYNPDNQADNSKQQIIF